MNITEQFPDISMAMRNKSNMHRKGFQRQVLTVKPISVDEKLAVYYDREFRRWHYKLIGIIVGCMVVVYAVILNLSWLFQWMLR
jgi:hypothetical protein